MGKLVARTNPMKLNFKTITFVCNHSRLGGDNISMLEVIQGLKQFGIQSTVILPERGLVEKKLNQLEINYRIIDNKIKKNTNKVQMFITLFKYLHTILKFKTDILHSNDIHCNKYVGWAARILNKSTVCHIRFKVDYLQAQYYLTPMPDHIIFNSQFMRDEFIKHSQIERKNRSSVIYDPIRSENYFKPEFRTFIREKWNAKEKFVIGIIGNICKAKGHYEFIKIVKILNRSFDDFLFVIIGEDISEDKVHMDTIMNLITSYGVKDNIIFNGIEEDIAKVLSGLDLMVFPSHFESFGRVVIEALLAKVPVVASRVGGLQEILKINPAARLVTLENIQGFVDEIIELRRLIEKTDKQIGSKGRKKVLEQFSFDFAIQDLVRCYQKITIKTPWKRSNG